MINNSLLTAEKPLRVRIEKIEDSQARLVFSDSQAFKVNIKYLPKEASVGDMIYLSLVSEEELSLTKKEVASELLDQILN